MQMQTPNEFGCYRPEITEELARRASRPEFMRN